MKISVTEAHRRFGDLARIRCGVTEWISVDVEDGQWVPMFDNGILVAYLFVPKEVL